MVKRPPKGHYRSIDEVGANIRSSLHLSSLRSIKYDTIVNDHRNKIEEAMVEIISNFKLAPSKIKKQIPQDLYDILKIRREWVEKEEK